MPVVVLGLSACGGSIAETASPDAGGILPDGAELDAFTSEDAPSTGVGPIDGSGQPTELTLTCDGSTPEVSLRLPCLLGGDWGGGLHQLECQLSTAPSTFSELNTVLTMVVPLTELSMQLNQAISLPFMSVPPPPPGEYGGGALGPLTGAAVFSQVDLVSYAFVGHITHAFVPWIGRLGDTMTCTVVDGPFWAVPGPFL